ncbi:MAG: hypothetical protein WBA23_04105 [Tunicatimonas sp.]|uniref:hypothetical protein n=1 Tax=Tunicatimonas sp. TaxID=1940096 RepID=UPI003C725B43
MDFKKQLEAFQAETRRRFNAVDAKLSVLKDNITDVQSEFKEISTAVDNVYEFMGEMYNIQNEEIADIKRRLSKLEKS